MPLGWQKHLFHSTHQQLHGVRLTITTRRYDITVNLDTIHPK